MPLAASCPRCTSPVTGEGASFACSVHGPIEPLWRPDEADYDSFAELVGRSDDLPTYLPWPMSPGWSIADFGCVGNGGRVRATVTTTVGTSDLDGEVEVTIVSEDPGRRPRRALRRHDVRRPGAADQQRPARRSTCAPAAGPCRCGWSRTPATSRARHASDDDLLARAVFAGEADGRWLWLVMKPASAALLLHDDWLLADVTGFGPEALEMPFGGPRPAW